jgi:hypothetical protein
MKMKSYEFPGAEFVTLHVLCSLQMAPNKPEGYLSAVSLCNMPNDGNSLTRKYLNRDCAYSNWTTTKIVNFMKWNLVHW